MDKYSERGFSPIIVTGVVLLILAAVSGGFFIFTKKPKSAQAPLQPIPIYESSPSPVANPNALFEASQTTALKPQESPYSPVGSKTFKNSESLKDSPNKYGFSFQYPDNWDLDETSNTFENEVVTYSLTPHDPNYNEPGPSVSIILINEPFVMKPFVAEQDKEPEHLMRGGIEYRRPYKLLGKEGYIEQTYGYIPVNSKTIEIPFKDQTFSISYTNPSKWDSPERSFGEYVSQAFEVVLKSLKFN